VSRAGVLLVTLACLSCGGRIDRADAPEDASSPPDVATSPADAARPADGGPSCSTPTVSLSDAASSCAFVIQCTSGPASSTLDGTCVGGNGLALQCLVDGRQQATFTKLVSCDCADAASFAPLAGQCMP
jgi:hypothetical protein